MTISHTNSMAPDAHRPHDLLLREWLAGSQDALFRWLMAIAVGEEGRRAVAQVAVAMQRLRGSTDYAHWLYATALQAASLQAGDVVAMEPTLVGLPPELRALLRLVAQGVLRREDALALLAQRMGYVRRSVLQARLDAVQAHAAHAAASLRTDPHCPNAI